MQDDSSTITIPNGFCYGGLLIGSIDVTSQILHISAIKRNVNGNDQVDISNSATGLAARYAAATGSPALIGLTEQNNSGITGFLKVNFSLLSDGTDLTFSAGKLDILPDIQIAAVTTSTAQTISNKTLNSPVINSPTFSAGAIGTTDIADGSITPAKNENVAGGTILLAKADNEVSTMSTSYVKVKEIIIARAGTIRFYVDVKIISYPGNLLAEVYRNGISVGQLGGTNSSSYTTLGPLDISGWQPGDLAQLYIKTDDGAQTAYAKNFRLYTTKVAHEIAVID